MTFIYFSGSLRIRRSICDNPRLTTSRLSTALNSRFGMLGCPWFCMYTACLTKMTRVWPLFHELAHEDVVYKIEARV